METLLRNTDFTLICQGVYSVLHCPPFGLVADASVGIRCFTYRGPTESGEVHKERARLRCV